jgi:hypothetical protein
MSRRIAYVFAVAACVTFVAPAGADPECFENTCRMPEVIELPQAPATAIEELSVADPAPPAAERAAAPRPTLPQASVDQLPPLAPRPLPDRRFEQMPDKPVRQVVRRVPLPSDGPSDPIEVMNRPYANTGQAPTYAAGAAASQPGASVVVVVPGVQYGADGVGLAQGRQDPSWELCQTDRRGDGRCTPYNYQPYGAYGYRPLGVYRPHQPVPARVYVPDAKIITMDIAD